MPSFSNLGTFTVTFGDLTALPAHFPVLSQGVTMRETTLAQYNVKEEEWYQALIRGLSQGFGTISISLQGIEDALNTLQAEIDQLTAVTRLYPSRVELKALTAIARVEGFAYHLRGLADPTDGLGGFWYWDSTSNLAANDNSVIQPNDVVGVGRFLAV